MKSAGKPDRRPVVPLPVGGRLDATAARGFAAGCRAVGTDRILYLASGDAPSVGLRPTEADLVGMAPPARLLIPDGAGALLFPEPGYALITGTEAFLAAAVAEGADAARARFGRYARTVKGRWPRVEEIARAYPPVHRVWFRAADVVPGTASAQLLSLLDDFTTGTCTAADFADGWREARRAARANGERTGGALAELFDRVFLTLEDYTPDPGLREAGDLTDTELREAIRTLGPA
ncbi:colicin immunity domain-containing protein [Streptomyces sp. NPDC006197]|uniref:colicin immunity domain-containing protein n=1 Tax=Streptomyces sp. NPDC006197 TaxID=3156685 RepID=UPI0033AF50F7